MSNERCENGSLCRWAEGRCLKRSPRTNLLCTQMRGHSGPHIACSISSHNLDTWPNDKPQVVAMGEGTPPTVRPDTSTLAGRIAVEQAALEGRKIQSISRFTFGAKWLDVRDPATHRFNWDHFDYRIAPEPPKPRYRPWRLEEIPCGAVVIPKDSPDSRAVIISVRGGFAKVDDSFHTSSKLMSDFTMLDGSPCGVKEGE